MIREPEPSVPSTTTVIRASAAMIRLRAGKLQRNGRIPGGISDTTRPLVSMLLVQASLAGRVGDVRPARHHRDRRARRPASAPCVRGGVGPEAIPLTTGTPHAARSRASERAISMP